MENHDVLIFSDAMGGIDAAKKHDRRSSDRSGDVKYAGVHGDGCFRQSQDSHQVFQLQLGPQVEVTRNGWFCFCADENQHFVGKLLF